jgi:DNA-binding IclR family transcriptional regulator
MPINPSTGVLRAGNLLWHLARSPSESYSVSELARMVGVPRATCDSILQALAEHGLVMRREPAGRYQLGAVCVALGDAARAAHPVLDAASAEAEQVARALKGNVAVCTRTGDEARVVAAFDHGPPFGIRAHVGEAIPLVPPFGAVFVAWDDAGADRWFAQADADVEERYLDHYRRALDAVRRRGYSVSVATTERSEYVDALETLIASPESEQARRTRDEMIREMQSSEYLATDIGEDTRIRLNQMSAPVFDAKGGVGAAIMLLSPRYDLTGAEVRDLGEQITRAADRATENARGGAMSPG